LLALPGPAGPTCIGRLQTLERLELARQEETGGWRPAEGWTESLAVLGERQDIIERLVPFVGERAVAYRVVDPQRPCAAFEGVVAGKGLDDELLGTMFAAVVAPAGEPFYVRATSEPPPTTL
jgi:hypothetical protein